MRENHTSLRLGPRPMSEDVSEPKGADRVASRADQSRLAVKGPRLFEGSDIRETILLGLSVLTTKTCPIEKWTNVVDKIHRLERRKAGRYSHFRSRVIAFFGPDADDAFAEALWHAHRTARHRRRMQVVAHRYLTDYRPEIRLEGQQHLDAALARGKGAILWFDSFVHHPVIGKRPFADAGYVSWQLSSLDHGFSRSKFGHAFLNPVQLSVEARYVDGRIAFNGSTAVAATREARQRLAANGIVRITNNAYIGRRVVDVPFGAAAWLSVATTPLNLSHKCGAALLPVAVLEDVPFRQYRVTVGPRLPVDGAAKEAAFRQTALSYASYLEPLVRARPEQWIGWAAAIDQPPPGVDARSPSLR